MNAPQMQSDPALPLYDSHQRPRGAARLAILAGLVVLGGLWLGPLPQMSRTAFSPHMILHLSIVCLAAPLLSYGLAAYLPAMRQFRNALSWSLLAAFFEMVVVWGWHIPALHTYAALYDTAFVLQQISFLAAGLAVWTMAFNARSRAAAAAGTLGLFLTFMHMSMFGLLLTFAPRLIYPPELCLGAFGLSPLEDQQFGGLLMAVAGGMPYLAGASLLAWRALGQPVAADAALTAGRADRPCP